MPAKGLNLFLLVEKPMKTRRLWEAKGYFFFLSSHRGQQSVSVCLSWLLEEVYLMSQEKNPNLNYSLWFLKSLEISIEAYRWLFFTLLGQDIWSMVPGGGAGNETVWIHLITGWGGLRTSLVSWRKRGLQAASLEETRGGRISRWTW